MKHMRGRGGGDDINELWEAIRMKRRRMFSITNNNKNTNNNHFNNDSLLLFTHDTLRRESNNQIEIRSNLLFNHMIWILSNKSLIDS